MQACANGVESHSGVAPYCHGSGFHTRIVIPTQASKDQKPHQTLMGTLYKEDMQKTKAIDTTRHDLSSYTHAQTAKAPYNLTNITGKQETARNACRRDLVRSRWQHQQPVIPVCFYHRQTQLAT